MKRTVITIIIIPIVMIAVQTRGVENQREGWWRARIDILAKERERLFGGGPGKEIVDRGLIKLFDAEEGRAREMLRLMGGSTDEGGPGVRDGETVSREALAAAVKKTAGPYAALGLLNEIAADYDTARTLEVTREVARKAVNAEIAKRTGAGEDAMAGKICSMALSLQDWKHLSIEVRLGALIDSAPARKAEFLSAVERDAAAALVERKGVVTAAVLEGTVRTAARGRMAAARFELSPDRALAALNRSWGWHTLSAAVAREVEGYNSLKECAGSTGRIPALNADFTGNPGTIDAFLFDASACEGEAEQDRAFAGGGNRLGIPRVVSFSGACREIDNGRRQAISRMTGREKEEYFAETRDRFTAVVERHAAGAEGDYKRELERINAAKDAPFANEKEFRAAEKGFRERRSKASEYADRSVRFMRWASRMKSVNAEAVLSGLAIQFRQNGAYLDFLKECVRGAASGGRHEISEELKNAVRKSDWLYAYAGGLAIDEGKVIAHMDRTQVLALREMKAGALRRSAAARADISRYLRDYGSAMARNEGGARKTGRRLDLAMAQQDMDILIQTAEEYASYYENLCYARTVFADCSAAYRRFIGEVKGGAVSRDYENVLRAQSLLAVVPAFDREKLLRESRTAIYLRKEGAAAILRYTAVADFYRRRNAAPPRMKTRNELAALGTRFHHRTEVAIGPWKMNESNFAEIDRRAAEALLSAFKKSTVSETLRYGRDVKKIVIGVEAAGGPAGPGIVFDLPGGWVEESTDGPDGRSGVIKCFRNGDDGSFIRIVRRPLNNRQLEDAAGEWHRIRRYEPVEKGWEKKNEIEFLRVLSRDGKQNVTETYAARRGDYAIMISGNAERARYQVLKKCLTRILETVKI